MKLYRVDINQRTENPITGQEVMKTKTTWFSCKAKAEKLISGSKKEKDFYNGYIYPRSYSVELSKNGIIDFLNSK